MTIWDVIDIADEWKRYEIDEKRWQMAMSPLDPAVIQARYQAIEKAQAKASAMDDFMERLAAKQHG